MCTALNYVSGSHYFGRNLDWTIGFGEGIVITPSNYPLILRNGEAINKHFSIVGMGIVRDNYPLYFDCVNDKGLCVAGLNFPDNAVYNEPVMGMYNITQFEFMPWILSQCEDVNNAMELLSNTNFINTSFSVDLPATPMHWIISDKNKSIVIEPTNEGLKLYDNPTDVLTNSPEFSEHMQNLTKEIPYSTSSESRFKRAVNIVNSAPKHIMENDCVDAFFGMLANVGIAKTTDDAQYTIYSSCINATSGIYYYKRYGDDAIYKTALKDFDLSGNRIIMRND